jgi:hypothetical protein
MKNQAARRVFVAGFVMGRLAIGRQR